MLGKHYISELNQQPNSCTKICFRVQNMVCSKYKLKKKNVLSQKLEGKNRNAKTEGNSLSSLQSEIFFFCPLQCRDRAMEVSLKKGYLRKVGRMLEGFLVS